MVTLGLAIFAGTLIVYEGKIFEEFRVWMHQWPFTEELISCFLCTSVWVAAAIYLASLLVPIEILAAIAISTLVFEAREKVLK